MGREVRMVPAGWEHPKDECGRYIPLMSGSADEAIAEWEEGLLKWRDGFRGLRKYDRETKTFSTTWVEKSATGAAMSYAEYAGKRPDPSNYMPDFQDGVATLYMMYETTSEGTPISPAMSTPEDLARWLAETGASAFGHMTADYEHWLVVCRGASAPSMVITNGRMESGVQALPRT